MQRDGVEIPNMRVANSRGYATIGDNAANHQCSDAGATENKLHPRLVKGRISDFFNNEVYWLKFINKGVAPAPGNEVTGCQEWPECLQMWRDERGAATSGN